jgi:hypothetical protein
MNESQGSVVHLLSHERLLLDDGAHQVYLLAALGRLLGDLGLNDLILVDPGCLETEDGSDGCIGVPASPELGHQLPVLGLGVVVQVLRKCREHLWRLHLVSPFPAFDVLTLLPILYAREGPLDVLHDDVIELLARVADDRLEELRAVVQDHDGFEEGGGCNGPPVTDVIVAAEGPGDCRSDDEPVIDEVIEPPAPAGLYVKAHDVVDGGMDSVNESSTKDLVIFEDLGDLIVQIAGKGIGQSCLVDQIWEELTERMLLSGAGIIDECVLDDCLRYQIELGSVPVEPISDLK